MAKITKYVERRKAPRFPISLPVTYKITVPPLKEQLKVRGITKDISLRGAALIVSNQPDSSVVNLQIELPASTKDKGIKSTKTKFITPKVRIVYSKQASRQQKDIHRTGVCFVELSKRDLALLRILLENYKKTY